jgi:hypothetical protein
MITKKKDYMSKGSNKGDELDNIEFIWNIFISQFLL